MSVVSLDAVREAVRRAELRRAGVLPLAPRDPDREQHEDDLLRLAERARTIREERAAQRALYPTASRTVIGLPMGPRRRSAR